MWEDDHDDEPAAPLLPRDDRLWRHPSEAAAERGTRLTALAAPPRQPALATVVTLTSCISVLMTLGLVAVLGPFDSGERVVSSADRSTSTGVTGLTDVAAIAERVRPAITRVEARHGDDTMRGSGVIWRSDGMMLTAHHVVNGASSISVLLDDGRQVGARVVGGDEDTDVAVLDLDGIGFATADMGTATGLRIGQAAVTIGSPNGAAGGPVVTVGVVSALGQEVTGDDHRFLDMIQTDAAVAPGCTGGAVVDSAGKVVGLAAANATTDAGTIGYATPIDVAKLVAQQLVSGGTVTRGWLGIEGDSLSAARAKHLDVKGGAVVRTVLPASPAAAADLVPGDAIIALDGDAVPTMAALVVALRSHAPGDSVALRVIGPDGSRRTATATLGTRPT